MKFRKTSDIRIFKIMIFLTVISFSMEACKKLDLKPKQSLVVPETLQDLQGMMDNVNVMNSFFANVGEVSADDYYVTEAYYNSSTILVQKNAYIWKRDLYNGVPIENSWDASFEKILYSNIVLESVQKFDAMSLVANDIKGQALFHRAHAFYMLSQCFAPVFDQSTAASVLGIPLRLSSDLNIKAIRSTVQETYDQIIADLLLAKDLLPLNSIYKTRPSKLATYGLLSRAYLAKGDYTNALTYAELYLQNNSVLIDYKTLTASSNTPIPQLNQEVVFHGTLSSTAILRITAAIVDPVLYGSYEANDLRKTVLFKFLATDQYAFKGNYNGGTAITLFGGIATDEIYLIKAECLARQDKKDDALKALNTLLKNRYNSTFVDVTAATSNDALKRIIAERRKELLFRGLRWTDLRRLNKDPQFATILTRKVGSQTYTMPPNDSRYTFPIPDYVIAFSGIQQNP